MQLTVLLSLLFLLSTATTITYGHNITSILGQHPSLSTFNHYLTLTHLAGEINRRTTITVCAVDNAAMSEILSKKPSISTIKNILSLHVLLDYFGAKKLHQIRDGTALAATMFQATGSAPGSTGFVNITDVKGGKVAFGPKDNGGNLDVFYVKSVEEIPYNISVIQISKLLPSDVAAAPTPEPSAMNITDIMSAHGCKVFADTLIANPDASKTYQDTIDGGLTVFCPLDDTFKAFLPKFKNLTASGKVSLLQFFGVPVYQSLAMLKSNNGIMNTLATNGDKKFDFTVQNDGEEAKADTNQESSPPQPTAEAAAPAESEAIKPAEAQKSDVETGATTESNKEQPAEEAKSNEEPPAQAEAAAPPPPPPPSDNAPAPIQVDKPPESDVAPSPPPQGPVCQNKEDPSPSSAAVNEPAQEDGDGIVFEPAFSKWGPAPPGPFPEIKVSGINAPQPIIRPVAPTSNYALEPQESISIERSAFDLVEKMHYLFVRVVKARYLPTSGNPVVRIEVSNSRVQSKPARKTSCFEWDQTFAFGRDAPDSSSIVEISVWDPHDPKSSEMAAAANFLGGICFDVTEIPLRDPPDSPLAPQWYRLEGGGAYRSDLMLATWVGTQADDSFPDAWKTDTAGNINSRAKVYLSPKLWYLRATVLEAQDIFPLMPLRETAVQVKAQLGFQVQKTKTSVSRNGTPSWNEDLLFVAAEPCSDQLIFTLESRQPKGPVSIGMVRIPLSAIERRVDDRKVASRWFSLEDPRSEKAGYRGRVQLRLCFDGGYHVMDEAAHMTSDYRPTARQLWKQPVGTFELGIIGCKNLSPMKTVDGKGCTDAYCVAKYGPKWVRTRTVCDSLDPKWNEQYTWKVYDPCTVLTIGVFDSSGVYEIDGDKTATRPDFRMGKVRVRLSTLETGKVYRNRFPLILLTNNGVKKMGEMEVAVKFVRATPTLDFLHVYTQPLLPLMHHLKPLGVVQQELLRNTAVKIIATHLSRSEPALRREVVSYMLDVDTHAFSMRKIRANWIRIINVIASVIDIVRWIDDTRVWKNPTSTILVHALLIMLVWFPDLIVPTLAFYVFVIGVWNYRFRSRAPLPHFDPKLSLADTADRDELDEEFDPLPSSRPPEMVRTRYDKLRMLGARVQTVLGDFATQGERLQALVTWRDPRATGIFVGLCFVVAMILYMVPSKMVAMASGFYFFRHPIFRDRMPSPALNFFRRLPSLSDRIM